MVYGRNITWSNHKIQQFSFFITYQMKLKTEEPSHRTFTSLSDTFKCLMDKDSLVPTYTKRGAIHETDSCTFS